MLEMMGSKLGGLEGFTEEIWNFVVKFVMESKSVTTMEDSLVQQLVTKYSFSQNWVFNFRFYFKYSLYSGVKTVFEIKDEDIKIKMPDTPRPPGLIVPDDIPNRGPGGIQK
jgi:hypothetical protein